MDAQFLLVGMSGSLRSKSFNTSVLNACFSLLPEAVSFEIASIADIPLYNADFDIPAANERPAAVKKFHDILAKADSWLFKKCYRLGFPWRKFTFAQQGGGIDGRHCRHVGNQ